MLRADSCGIDYRTAAKVFVDCGEQVAAVALLRMETRYGEPHSPIVAHGKTTVYTVSIVLAAGAGTSALQCWAQAFLGVQGSHLSFETHSCSCRRALPEVSVPGSTSQSRKPSVQPPRETCRNWWISISCGRQERDATRGTG